MQTFVQFLTERDILLPEELSDAIFKRPEWMKET